METPPPVNRQLLEDFLETDAEHLWVIDPQVHVDQPWDEFQSCFDECEADLLATMVRTRADDPDWTWWKSLKPEGEESSAIDDSDVAALLPLMRVSRAAAEAILAGTGLGWTGHPEALLPTLVSRAGLVIEDIGGPGCFTPEYRRGSWYDERTWHWCGPIEHVPGRLHFPLPQQQLELAPARISPVGEKAARMLYVSPVGGGAVELLPDVLDVFQNAGADILLLQYDNAELPVTPEARIVRDRGYKWQLAVRHLHPDHLKEYDYIFFWDDDMGVEGFDPARFVEIMQMNRLEMAQPAIQSPHGLSHAITRHRACPLPFRSPIDDSVNPVVGRLTNFVEIMVPVFTREAWREFYGYLEPENRSGWGYDYIPLGRKGIVDALPVVHTRAVQSINGESERELKRFMDSQGIFRHTPVEHGWLFG
jgi:hypothetical protein